MASAGIRKTSTGRYKVWWRLDDGTQGAKTFDNRNLARDFKNELLAQVAADSWTDPRRGRILFNEWADHWWQLWSSSPRRSPKGMERIFGHERRRTFTPQEFGHFLAACRPFYCDHFLAQVGTGLRSGELLGLRRRRVYPELRRIEVIEVRYEAGRFGRGFKAEPKSPTSVRVVPMSEQVSQAIGRELPAGARPDDLVFPGPGGSNGIPRGARTPLSTHNLRRVYQAAVAAAGEDLAHLDLDGPHDLRHTFATWLEDAGIPSRVIDELMGHTGGRRQGGASGSPMGRVYRETTPTMLARVTAALDERIGRAVAVAGNLPRDAEGWTGTEAG